MEFHALILILLTLCILQTEQQRNNMPSSPCPSIFLYKFDGNKWYGELQIESPSANQREITLQVSLSVPAPEVTSESKVGSISMLGSSQDVASQVMQRLPLKFRVQFPYPYPIPKLLQVIYNDQLVCTSAEEALNQHSIFGRFDLNRVLNTYTNYKSTRVDTIISSKTGHSTAMVNGFPMNFMKYQQPRNPSRQKNLRAPIIQSSSGTQRPRITLATTAATPLPYYIDNSDRIFGSNTNIVSEISPKANLDPIANVNINRDAVKAFCGTRYTEFDVSPLIFGGEDTKRGDWPWMVAIYLIRSNGLSYNCGGSLVSHNVVVTAAHCINTDTKNYRPHEVLLWLGRYNLLKWNEAGSVASNVKEIIVHSDYKSQPESYDADVAILTMDRNVEFNRYVRPVCLWSDSTSIQEEDGLKGTVVGWGKYDAFSVVSNTLRRIDLPIVNSTTCLQTSKALHKAVSNRTFCAGTLNGSGPCHGDSGSGLVFQRNNRWVLGGIVSAGLSDANSGACKLTDYVVFTDISQYTSWILSYLHI